LLLIANPKVKLTFPQQIASHVIPAQAASYKPLKPVVPGLRGGDKKM